MVHQILNILGLPMSLEEFKNTWIKISEGHYIYPSLGNIKSFRDTWEATPSSDFKIPMRVFEDLDEAFRWMKLFVDLG